VLELRHPRSQLQNLVLGGRRFHDEVGLHALVANSARASRARNGAHSALIRLLDQGSPGRGHRPSIACANAPTSDSSIVAQP
jgi:hypothetical protein